MFAEILALLKKDFVLELRERNAINSVLLYAVSAVFVCYLGFGPRAALTPATWNVLLWIILLFAAFSGVSRCFDRETGDAYFFYYVLASPEALILSKIIYNTVVLCLTAFLALAVYVLVMGSPVQDIPLFAFVVLLGSAGFSAALTLVAGITAKAGSNLTLMAVLGFPVVLPILLMVIKASKNAMDGLARSASYDELLTIFALDLIVATVSFFLFPYLWRG